MLVWKDTAVRMLLVEVLRIATNLPGRGTQACQLWVTGSLDSNGQMSLLTSLNCKEQEPIEVRRRNKSVHHKIHADGKRSGRYGT